MPKTETSRVVTEEGKVIITYSDGSTKELDAPEPPSIIADAETDESLNSGNKFTKKQLKERGY